MGRQRSLSLVNDRSRCSGRHCLPCLAHTLAIVQGLDNCHQTMVLLQVACNGVQVTCSYVTWQA